VTLRVPLTFEEQHRMEEALRRIGYSRHSNLPRIGPKAQIARWGLGEDELPEEEQHEPNRS
jgi:hypothetical protein